MPHQPESAAPCVTVVARAAARVNGGPLAPLAVRLRVCPDRACLTIDGASLVFDDPAVIAAWTAVVRLIAASPAPSPDPSAPLR